MMKKIALAVVLSTTALSAVAEESKDFYAQVNAGYAWGMKSSATVDNEYSTESNEKFKMGKSFSIGLEGGAQINEYLRAGLSFDYMPSFKADFSPASGSMTFTGGTEDYKSGTINFDYDNAKVKSMNLMANLFIDAGNFSGFKPYAVVGLGMARNKASSTTLKAVLAKGAIDIDDVATTSDLTVASKTFSGKTKYSFAYKVGLGFKYAVNEDFDVDVRYQYLDLGKAKWEANGKSSTLRLRANQLMLGVAYKF